MTARTILAISLAIAAPALSPARAEDDFLPGRDDPRGRAEARLKIEGLRSLEGQMILLEEAAREARRWHIGEIGPDLPTAVAGKAWVNVGPASGVQVSPILQAKTDAGRVRKIVPHPTDPNILYVATAGGGVWKSFDAQATISSGAGPHWMSITSGVGSQSVGAFALDPNSPDSLFLGLGDPFDVQSPGFYTSADGGITWAGPVALGNATSVRDIVVNPSRTGVVLVATNDGIYRSSAGGLGASFSQKETGDCWSIAWVGGQTWLAACNGAVWRSTDDGASFVSAMLGLADVGRMTLAAAASDSATPNGARVYLLAANAAGGDQKDVFSSGNGGQSWNSLTMLGTAACKPTCAQPQYWTNDQPDFDVMHDQAWYNQAIIADPRTRDRFFIGGNLSMIRCDGGGLDRTQCYVLTDWLPGSPIGGAQSLPYVHADWHAMAISTTGNVAYFYAGTDGGLFRSSDAFTATPNGSSGTAPNFEDRLNRGIETHLVYSVATDLHNSSNPVMIGGLQDNGTRLRVVSTPTTFDQVIGGDGFGVGIGIANSSATPVSCAGKMGSLLVGTIYTAIWRSIDCGSSFALAMNGICSSPSLLSGNPCGTDYGSNFFMKMASDQADATGQTFVSFFNNSNCSPSASQCTTPGGNSVYATHNGAASWSNASGTIHLAGGGTAASFPYQLSFVGANAKAVAAGQWAVADTLYAYTTVDGGQNWVQSSGPNVSVSSVAFEGTSGTVIWATQKADPSTHAPRVMRSADRGATWADKTGDLPNAPASVVAVDPNDSMTIYLGTEIGLYRTQNGGTNWLRYGTGLPLVSVTEINVALDSSAIRISTFGRGFWELYPVSGALSGVHGNGDFDKNQVIDAFDLVREAALLGETPVNDDYDQTGNLVGTTNGIDGADFSALILKLGGRP